MRRILMLSLLAAAACGGPSRGELEVDWTFEGVSCLDAGVAFIQVAIAHEDLSPNQFTCQEASLGANLGVYYAGDYQLTVTGLDSSLTVTHQATQTLRVDGGKKNSYAVDVPRTAPPTTATANLKWIFDNDPSKTCAAAGVDQVTIMVDPDSTGSGGINAGTVPCTAGNPDPSMQPVTQLSPGTHTFAILGSRGNTLIYRTHNPASGFFAAGLTTNVTVKAEPLP